MKRPIDVDAYSTINRRTLLRGLALYGVAAVSSNLFSRSLWASPVFREYPFKLGVASGDPSPDGFVIWTRIAPNPEDRGGMPNRPVPLRWELATDERMRDIVANGDAVARPEIGHAVHVEVGGLEPYRPYFYRFEIGEGKARQRSQIGRAMTLPTADQPVDNIRFGVAGCQRYEDGYYTAYRHLADEQLDFVFHYGDYIYEAQGVAFERLVRSGQNPRAHDLDETYTLTDYRKRYGLYKRDLDLLRAHLSAPFIATFDDHEVVNNWAGGLDREQHDTPPELFLLRRAAAFQAFYEHLPLRKRSLPRMGAIQAYRRFALGDLMDMHVLDTRQYRTPIPCDDATGPRCEGAADKNASMLGAEQEQWLFDGLRHSTSRWNVIAQQVPVMQVNRAGDTQNPTFNPDKWDGYLEPRKRLLNTLGERTNPNNVVLSGDVHNNWAGELRTDFDDPSSKIVGTEFIATSITSGGDGADQVSRTPKVLAANPHIKFYNNQRGYMSHEVTPEGWTARFRIVERVSVPDEPLKTRASFRISAGESGFSPV